MVQIRLWAPAKPSLRLPRLQREWTRGRRGGTRERGETLRRTPSRTRQSPRAHSRRPPKDRMNDLGNLLSGTDNDVLDALLHPQPWICEKMSVDFRCWSGSILSDCGFPRASRMHLVGSASIGISLSPAKAGRPFRTIQDGPHPSDLDVALIDDGLFIRTWNRLRKLDEQAVRSNWRTRENVYWGRLQDSVFPARSAEKRKVMSLSNAIRRSREFRGYPVSVRVYRRKADLRSYLRWSLAQLRRSQ